VITEPPISQIIAENPKVMRSGLTAREYRMLQLTADGLTYPQMAAVTQLSQNACRYAVTKAMTRLAARSRAHMVAIAFRRGILGRAL
jgi:DNA-binding CsgD family transcriptional regulator